MVQTAEQQFHFEGESEKLKECDKFEETFDWILALSWQKLGISNIFKQLIIVNYKSTFKYELSSKTKCFIISEKRDFSRSNTFYSLFFSKSFVFHLEIIT